MTWLITAHGHEVDLRVMDPMSIHIEDIAHHLAQINRFTGACSRPYSVAEHSLLACEIAERELGFVGSPKLLLAVLMHDAHEAYTNDMSSPMKQLLGAAWKKAEDRIQLQVLGRFGLIDAFVKVQRLLKRADLMALLTERAALLPPGSPWEAEREATPVLWAGLRARSPSLTWKDWRQAFRDRFDELTYAAAETSPPSDSSEPA